MGRVAFLVLSIVLLATGARAEYPDKPVRIVVPFIAGSAPDVAARQVAQRLTASLGQQFIIDNKPGAAGNIGAEVAARAAPDGYTLMLLTSSHLLNPFLYARVNYDPMKDFAPITLITRIPSLMVVPPSSPAKTVAEFVALAKSMPGKLNYGSGGAGSLAHLSAEAFRFATGIDYVHVPFKGAPEIVLGLLSEQVQVGALRPLAVTSAKRTTVMPEVPTLLEAIADGFALEAWLGLVAPTGTPTAIIARLHVTLAAASTEPLFRQALGSDGSEIVLNSPAELGALMREEQVARRALIERVGVKLE
jgi:tripartite-type tricarboxylate transporter receptor subunit TctC